MIVAFDFKAYNSLAGPLGIQLYSILPNVSAASGLKAAAKATASAQRANTSKTDTSGIGGKARLAEQRAASYQRLSSKLNSTVKAATKARDTLYDLKTILSDMRRLIVLSQGDTITDAERHQNANTFDQLLGKLNLKVSSSGGIGGNLIGSSIRDIFTPQDIVYKTKPDSPVTQSISGVYSGSDYTITDGSGNVFFADIFGSQLNQFPFDESVDGEYIGNNDAVSFDSDTGAVSITHDGESDPFISGTVERKGLGLLHSYFYGDFTDPALLDKALTDLDAASAKLRFNITVIESQVTKATAHRDFNKKLIEEHQALGVKLQTEKSSEEQKSALEAQRQQLLFASAYQGTLSFDASGTLLSLGIDSLFDFKA